MRKLLILLSIFLFTTAGAQKERNDGEFVVHMREVDSEDLKCDIHKKDVAPADIQKLMDEGRYVVSVNRAKFGTIVLHRKNTEGVSQLFDIIPLWDLKKKCKANHKLGFVLDYYNDERRYTIFRKDPKVKTQVVLNKVDKKTLKKQRDKGLYVTLCSYIAAVAQDGRDDIEDQMFASYIRSGEMLEAFRKLPAEWVVGSVVKSYNEYGDYSFYEVIYDKPKKKYEGEEFMAVADNQDRLVKILKEKVDGKFNINRIWCGWENYDYEARAARIASFDDNIFDVLTGLANTVTGIKNLSKGSAGGGTDTGADAGYTETGTGGAKAKAGKCRRCGGNGKCSPTSGAGRKNACHGSGLCGYCSGTGWIKAGASEARCTACNGKGKCKTCGGSGKCPSCRGTGK